MKILLDTHIALWAMTDTAKLSEEVIHMLESGKMKCIIVLPLWEIAIKHKIRPEQMPISEEEFVRLCEKTGFTQLSIEPEHIFC